MRSLLLSFHFYSLAIFRLRSHLTMCASDDSVGIPARCPSSGQGLRIDFFAGMQSEGRRANDA
jgi:hypothetical protein